MATSQICILILFISIVGSFIYALIDELIEQQKAFKKEYKLLRRAYRKQNEEYEKQEFLFRIKNGLSTANR